MTAQQTRIDESLLLDWGSRIGLAARKDKVESSQLENLIISLDALEGREALLATAAFALRQAGRLGGGDTAKLVVKAMLDLYSKNAGKEDAKRTLSFAKWVFEALKGKDINLELKVIEEISTESFLKWFISGKFSETAYQSGESCASLR